VPADSLDREHAGLDQPLAGRGKQGDLLLGLIQHCNELSLQQGPDQSVEVGALSVHRHPAHPGAPGDIGHGGAAQSDVHHGGIGRVEQAVRGRCLLVRNDVTLCRHMSHCTHG